jgi:hypothetical protein
MSLSFYNTSVVSYLQTLGAIANVLEKGQFCASENGRDVEELMTLTLRDDMAPLPFQIISVWHHSMGAIKGMQEGLFTPPPKKPGLTYGGLLDLVAEAREFLEGVSETDINALSGRDMVFRLGEREIPFTTDNFLVSFSLPNFYFHATTTYALLRKEGVPLGKIDYLGQLRVGH